MPHVIPIAPLTTDRFASILSDGAEHEFERVVARGSTMLGGRVVWNVNSTANGGGVAEMLRSLIAYARGAGVDARWVVIEGDPDFFRITKRIHNRLHDAPGDGGDLGDRERAIYEAVAAANARKLGALVHPGDLVLLHDPQTAGLVDPLRARGAHVIWRCHVGIDAPDSLAHSAWRFLLPYVKPADAYVFSREAFTWDDLDHAKLAIIPPSIDAFSPKNQEMGPRAVAGILYAAGLADHDGRGAPTFERHDGTPGRVDRRATMIEEGPLRSDDPLVTQVSRWDRLKDPLGVMEAFVEHVASRTSAHLVLAGPDVTAVADDPEGLEVFESCIDWRSKLPLSLRARIHLAALPMADADENAAIVNALQRRSTVVVQKSIAEGFGLTVSEAMWKGRPVVASRIGGIQDQIADGDSGILVDPRDLRGFGDALVRLLEDEELAERMGTAARERVRSAFLGPRHLGQYLDLFERVMAASGDTVPLTPVA